MFNRALAIPFAVLTLAWSSTGKSPVSAGVMGPLIESIEADDVCLMPPTLEQRAEYRRRLPLTSPGRGPPPRRRPTRPERPRDGLARTRSVETSRPLPP